ncbi:hypothetical protein CK203_113758 [Vitis vinifera]|uniref:Uncharacterized protein n=1 Tax=Vitis vinifera TaxID=29760 RepID=A0A438CPM3_VITVI|nr:hypothetical protein CK203_113758 [Vitis vinifera]
MGQIASEVGGDGMAKLPASGNRQYLFCFATVVGGAAKGVRSASGDQKWVWEGTRG